MRAVLASVPATVTVLAGAAEPASAATLPMTLSVTYGPKRWRWHPNRTVTPTPAAPTVVPSGSTPAIQFQFVGTTRTGCSASATSNALIAGSGTTTTDGVVTAPPATANRITLSKIMFQSLTAMTGPRAGATGLDVTINMPGGTVSSLDPDNDASLNGAINSASGSQLEVGAERHRLHVR